MPVGKRKRQKKRKEKNKSEELSTDLLNETTFNYSAFGDHPITPDH